MDQLGFEVVMDKVLWGVVVNVDEGFGELGEPFEDQESIERLLVFTVLADQHVQVAILE